MSAGQSSIDDLLQGVGKKLGLDPKLVDSVRGMLESDGIAGIVKKFQEQGLDDVISSWIGKGENRPVSRAQVKDVLGEKLDQLSAETGETKDRLSDQLSELLPGLIDKLTPDGKVPENDWLRDKIDSLRRYAK